MTHVWLVMQRDLDGVELNLCACPDEATAERLRAQWQVKVMTGAWVFVEKVPVVQR